MSTRTLSEKLAYLSKLADNINRRMCIEGCGLAAAEGDVYCEACRSARCADRERDA